MELLANDQSLHEQFHSVAAFREAFSRVMGMRNAARVFGRELHCQRALLIMNPIARMSMQQAIMAFPIENERRAAMVWLSRAGPFWDDARQHTAGDWLESGDEVVTDTAIGEAAFRMVHGVGCGLVSFFPSSWNFTPIEVWWRREDAELGDRSVALENWWEVTALREALRSSLPSIASWDGLREASRKRFGALTFADGCFEPLRGVPFSKSAADRFVVLLGVLDQLARAFDERGERNAEGHRISQDHFTGECALFSDSSSSEKRKFRRELTFTHPEDATRSLFCPWHGKVSHLTLRLHFSWPVEAEKPVYIVYAGPKITKR